MITNITQLQDAAEQEAASILGLTPATADAWVRSRDFTLERDHKGVAHIARARWTRHDGVKIEVMAYGMAPVWAGAAPRMLVTVVAGSLLLRDGERVKRSWQRNAGGEYVEAMMLALARLAGQEQQLLDALEGVWDDG